MARITSCTRTRRNSGTGRKILTALMVFVVLGTVSGFPYRKSNVKTLRLCSKNLSDALNLACQGRGYNEPFPQSGEFEFRGPPGPGLVEECCYHKCSYAQLEQYCKPNSKERLDESRDVIMESFRIVYLPYSSVRRELSSAESLRSGIDDYGDTVKRSKRDNRI